MHGTIDAYLTWLQATNHALATVRNRRSALKRLEGWCNARGVEHISELTLSRLEDYRIALFDARNPRGDPLGWGTQAEYLGGVRAFLGWCFLHGIVDCNPGAGLTLPRRPVRLPLSVLNVAEVERVLRVPQHHTSVGLRDRAILEVLYSTGLRRAEAVHLGVADVDQSRRVLLVRAGKGQRDRVVPLGRRALIWINRYLVHARPVLAGASGSNALFLTKRGRPLRLNRLSERIQGYVTAAGLGKRGSCHLFRHTMATHLLEGGADVRDVQEILGHTNLSTTARYTHVSIARLQQVHARAHPAERRYLGKGLRE